MRKPAFLLFGGFTTGKYPNFVSAIEKFGLEILVIDLKNDSTEENLRRKETIKEHPFGKIKEFAIVHPDETNEILQQIKVWEHSYDIQGVYNIRESFVEVFGLIADYLELPSPGFRACRVCRNKFLQRLFLQEWSPHFTFVTRTDKKNNFEIEQTSFPVVLKPIDRQGSSGVVVVNSKQEMLQAIEAEYTKDKCILIEQYIQGREYSVETIIQNREIIFSCPTQKTTNESKGNHFVEMSHTIPPANLTVEESKKLLDINRRILKKLDFQNGIAHAEYKIDVDGKIYIMEIAARNPGDGILPLYHLSTGSPMEDALIAVALGKEIEYPLPKRFSRQVYLDHTPGIFVELYLDKDLNINPIWLREKGIRPELVPSDIDAPPQIKELLIERNKGDRLSEIKQSGDRCGSYIFDSDTKENLDSIERQLSSKITIKTESYSEGS